MNERESLLESLNAAFGDLCNSLAHYIVDAGAYVRPGEKALLGVITVIADEDRRLSERVAGAIERLEGIPQLVTMNPADAALNYLSLEYLAGVLETRLAEELARRDAALVHVAAAQYPEPDERLGREALAECAQARRSQLQRLRTQRAATAAALKR